MKTSGSSTVPRVFHIIPLIAAERQIILSPERGDEFTTDQLNLSARKSMREFCRERPSTGRTTAMPSIATPIIPTYGWRSPVRNRTSGSNAMNSKSVVARPAGTSASLSESAGANALESESVSGLVLANAIIATGSEHAIASQTQIQTASVNPNATTIDEGVGANESGAAL